ncbi:probable proline iminopeptidase [Aplysia californica]|uniref:Proline iminopeptidase n=1 Tax=Aplysia californica TaxID=6500 RepID=A0ABM1W1I8_APLCA|nr:probable proline iminopeptidase [Aplysia californica]XP_035828530.1 probable proline iminopeptidase [Aplysia californica]XP_035828531.1 probable proline iminopeptidase [Aplysia californica]
MADTAQRSELYPDIEPYDSGFLQVSDLHSLYYEQSGNPKGLPVLFLHGGPGAGVVVPKERCWFDPEYYRIILFDQRGAGRSTPLAEVKDNTTWDLVSDMEKLREKLDVEDWVIFGCSWGSTLALVYAESHPQRVKALVIQGIFLSAKREVDWFYVNGCSMLWPELYEEYSKIIPPEERKDMIKAYYKRLTSEDYDVCLAAARAWSLWELQTIRPQIDPSYVQYADDAEFCLKFARIECHYFINGGFLGSDSYILDNVHKLKDIPVTIINGRFDVITPMESAWKLHKCLPKSELVITPMDGHSDEDLGIRMALLNATEKYKTLPVGSQ